MKTNDYKNRNSNIISHQLEICQAKNDNKPYYFRKRVGSTTYCVGVHFSKTNSETAMDKINCLVRMEAS